MIGMERMTFWTDENKTKAITNIGGEFGSSKIMNKLAEYEDLEEEGLILRLPCKIGGTVYSLGTKHVIPHVVKDIFIDENNIMNITLKSSSGTRYISANSIGKTIFATLQEALSAMGDSNEGNY